MLSTSSSLSETSLLIDIYSLPYDLPDILALL